MLLVKVNKCKSVRMHLNYTMLMFAKLLSFVY